MTEGAQMFGIMDLGTQIAMVVTFVVVVGAAVVSVRRFGARRR
jgi:hypothetical protein